MDEKLLRKMVSSIKCSQCGQHYGTANTDLLGHRDRRLWVFSVSCPSCGARRRLVVAGGVDQRTELPQVDAEHIEAETSDSSTPLTSDDVLEMHVFLKDFNGDFRTIFCHV